MFEKLLTLLLHSKSAVVAVIFVGGTSAALVTGSIAQNVVAVATPSASPTTAVSSPSPSSTNTLLATLQQLLSGKPQEKSGSSTTGTDCSQAAHDRNAALAAARKIWSEARADVRLLEADAKAKDLSKSEVKPILETAKKAAEDARTAAYTSIQGAWKDVVCAGKGDEDKADQDEDKDDDSTSKTTNTVTAAVSTPTPTPTLTTATTVANAGTTTVTTDEDESKDEHKSKDDAQRVALTAAPQVKFDTTTLSDKYAAFVQTELDAVNAALDKAWSDLSALKPSTDKADKDAKKHDVKKSSHSEHRTDSEDEHDD